jgi:outer membrane receptor protein involved in Fe transport
MRPYLAAFTILLGAAGYSFAAGDRLIEEIVVSAQRVEESAQIVPISLSAFTDALIEDRQIVGLLDVQLNSPNVSATDSNFGDRELSIRGLGNLLDTQGRTQTTVSYHVNEVPLDPPLAEFYDLQRLELLRGPQGTLYGRDSTAGAVNAITKRPSFEGVQGEVSVEFGNYDLMRVKGALEVTASERFAVRIAGFKLDRDGYINNLADGQVPGVDDDLDGRDVYSFRITPEWRVSDRTTVWMMFERTKEDDDRVRISNQICQTNPLPTLGCVPDAFALEPPNPSANTGGRFLGLFGAIPLGASDASTGLQFDFPRPELGLRDQHTDFEPVYEFDSDTWIIGAEHSFDQVDVSLVASYREFTLLSQQDVYMDVGYTLAANPLVPSGLWPTSQPSTDPTDPFGGPCPLIGGNGGVVGGCILDVDRTRAFSYDQAGRDTEAWTAEVKIASRFDGPLNFLLGGQYVARNAGDSYAQANNWDDGLAGAIGLYPTMQVSQRDDDLTVYAAFGELYWTPSERVKVTAGLRYSNDKRQTDTPMALLNANFVPGVSGTPIRSTLGAWLFTGVPDEPALALTDYYGATAAALAAGDFAERAAALQAVPPIPTFGEANGAFGEPDTFKSDGVSGRLGVDWLLNSDVMLYGFYSRGRSPGGFTLFDNTRSFDEEKVHAFEVGAKSTLLDGSLLMNVAAFFNILDGTPIRETLSNGEAAVRNLDAEAWGLEIESLWRPTNNLSVELNYGWLNTQIKNEQLLDVIDPTQGDPDLVLLANIAEPQNNYVAPRDAVLAVTPQAIAAGAAIPAPGTLYADGIPAWFSQPFLEQAGVATSTGVPANLAGNHMPTAPEHTLRLGLAYTWFWQTGSLTARWDYYWQDVSYSRVFNRPGDKIDAWDQHNASLGFASADGRWMVKAWARNIGNDDNVTDHFQSNGVRRGLRRNYFLMEPRIYGATFEYSFGR